MTEITPPTISLHRRRPLGATLWFLWMVVMWDAFFVLLFAYRLDGIWDAVRDLPLLVEVVAWVAFLPWMLGTAVWTSAWPAALRVLLVACFAVGWTIVSIPREKPTKRRLPPTGVHRRSRRAPCRCRSRQRPRPSGTPSEPRRFGSP